MDPNTPNTPVPDLSKLDDPAFLTERRRVRALLEHTPEGEVPPGLTERIRELDEEFIRRARLAWQDAPLNPQPSAVQPAEGKQPQAPGKPVTRNQDVELQDEQEGKDPDGQ